MAVDDFLFDVGGFFVVFEFVFALFTDAVEICLRDVGFADVEGVHAGDLHGEIVCEFFERVGFGYEVGFAVELEDGANAAVVDVAVDETFAGFAVTAFFGFCEAFFAHSFEGFVEVAFCFFEGLFSIC